MLSHEVRCIDCAFLGQRVEMNADGKPSHDLMAFTQWGLIELPARLRTSEALFARTEKSKWFNCEKGQIDLLKTGRDELIRLVQEPRRCEWFETNADLSFADASRARQERLSSAPARWWRYPPEGLVRWVAMGAGVAAIATPITGALLKLFGVL